MGKAISCDKKGESDDVLKAESSILSADPQQTSTC